MILLLFRMTIDKPSILILRQGNLMEKDQILKALSPQNTKNTTLVDPLGH
ncbi:hypothetical protein HMPREF3219_0201537 [Streptococcus salivarius]|nr:hypothetical protein HMPREF3219_0201537 [Streptococcus salivarius]